MCTYLFMCPVSLLNIKKAEAFAVFFLSMFVMHLVSPSHRPEIGCFEFSKNLESLMYINIVDKCISHAVQCYAHSAPEQGIAECLVITEEHK